MMLILQSGGHFDLLTAALSESGLSGLADEFAAEESTDSAGLSNQVCLKLVKVKQLYWDNKNTTRLSAVWWYVVL